LHSGRDRLLELNSGGAGEGEALVEAIEEQDDDFALPIYMERARLMRTRAQAVSRTSTALSGNWRPAR
ncbi:hypothetical protein KZ850_10420, partial [Pseudomonas aeruginosa]|nr:hypothetical protein [Pseudomonas aeruginosa]